MDSPDTDLVDRYEFSTDEFRLLRERLPEFLIPPFLDSATFQDLVPEEADRRRVLAAASLRARGLGRADGAEAAGEHGEGLPATLLAALALPALAEFVFESHSWSHADNEQRVVSVYRGSCAGITLIRSRASIDQGDTATDLVVITVFPIGELSGQLMEPVVSEPRLDGPMQSTVLGLVESRSLIEALRSGGADVVASLAHEFHAEQALPLLRDLTGSMDSGFRLRLIGPGGRTLFTGDWFRADPGWLQLRLIAARDDDAVVTAESLTERGRVRISRVGVDLIRADVLTLITGIALESHVA